MGILFTVAYDGTNYCGWQEQKNGVSVQSTLTAALMIIFTSDFTLLGASRTDAGVHALGQRTHLISTVPSIIPTGKLPLVINGHLPPDIRIMDAKYVPDGFHPINDAKSKTYCYKIYNARYQNPLQRGFCAHVPLRLDVAKMAKAAKFFIGEKDFAAFCSRGSAVKTTVRKVNTLDVDRQGDIVNITINGNGFLYNMVRIIAGTLVGVGLGKITLENVPEIIQSCDRTRAGRTMPPQGLVLLEIYYNLPCGT